MTTIFIVIMYRYGRKNSHSYPIGAYLNPVYASLIGKIHGQFRGGKYSPEIIRFNINSNTKEIFIKQTEVSEENYLYNFYSKPIPNSEAFSIEEIPNNFDKEFIEEIHQGLSLSTFYTEEEEVLIRNIYENYIRNLT